MVRGFGTTALACWGMDGAILKRWIKRLGIAGAVILGLLLIFLCVEHVRGQWGLNHYVAALEGKGETLSVSPLKPKRPPDEDNVAIALMALSERLKASSTNAAIFPPGIRFAAPGRAVVIWKMQQWLSGEEAITWERLVQDQVFEGTSATVYYNPRTAGWADTYGGLPTFAVDKELVFAGLTIRGEVGRVTLTDRFLRYRFCLWATNGLVRDLGETDHRFNQTVVFSPDGSLLCMSGNLARASVRDMASGEIVFPIPVRVSWDDATAYVRR